jgi:carboxymethylenebutenolidase
MSVQFDRHFRNAMRGSVMVAALTLAAAPGLAKTPVTVTEKDVTIATPDGTADAAVFTPSGKGPFPAVILWHDLAGLRPAIRGLGKTLAAEGYVVLEPNAFYRSAKATGEELDMRNPDIRKRQTDYRTAATDEGIARDAIAYVTYLDGLKTVAHKKKIGTLGYDVGGSYAFRTAAAVPERIGAVASIHGLGGATARPNSPHLLIPQTKASYFIVQSKDDDTREPDDKEDYKKKIAEGHLKGDVEVYDGNHGFAIPGNANYDAASASKAQAGILALFKSTLK